MKFKRLATESDKLKNGINNPIVKSIIGTPYSKTDPEGSYTAKPINPWEEPVQDADDL